MMDRFVTVAIREVENDRVLKVTTTRSHPIRLVDQDDIGEPYPSLVDFTLVTVKQTSPMSPRLLPMGDSRRIGGSTDRIVFSVSGHILA